MDPFHPDRVLADLAARQHGIVGTEQLLEAGLSRSLIQRRINSGHLHRIHRGVFQVGAVTESSKAAWMAALLATGRDSALTHRSGAQLAALLPLTDLEPIHVTTPRSLRGRHGIRLHQAALSPKQLTVIEGIRVTTLARTVFDLASCEPRWIVEKALRAAEAKAPGVWSDLAGLVDQHPGHKGTRILRAILGGTGLARSALEARFRRFLEAQRLPLPKVNVVLTVGGRQIEVDCLWRHQQLIAELDGRAFHSGSQAFEADRERDRLLQAVGWRVVRITWRQLHDQPALVARDLRQLLR